MTVVPAGPQFSKARQADSAALLAGLTMRILLAIHNAYTDATSGAAHSMRILMHWLADGGHECRVLSTARFDAKPPDSIDDHLTQLDVPLQKRPPSKIFM